MRFAIAHHILRPLRGRQHQSFHLPHRVFPAHEQRLGDDGVADVEFFDAGEGGDRLAVAKRERRAKVIHAEGEMQASEKLLQAAQVLAQSPQAMQLRYLQTLTNIATDKTTTIVFLMPMDVTDLLAKLIPEKRSGGR